LVEARRETYRAVAEEDRVFCERAFSVVLAGIRAHTEQGAELGGDLGLVL
jgi:hypothetical protein